MNENTGARTEIEKPRRTQPTEVVNQINFQEGIKLHTQVSYDTRFRHAFLTFTLLNLRTVSSTAKLPTPSRMMKCAAQTLHPVCKSKTSYKHLALHT